MFDDKMEILENAVTIYNSLEKEYNIRLLLRMKIELDDCEIEFSFDKENEIKYLILSVGSDDSWIRKYKTLAEAKRIIKIFLKKNNILTKEEETIKDIIC